MDLRAATDLLDGVAALDGAGAAGRGGLAASAADLEGSGGRKKGHGSEGKGSDAGEHVGSVRRARLGCERTELCRPEA